MVFGFLLLAFCLPYCYCVVFFAVGWVDVAGWFGWWLVWVVTAVCSVVIWFGFFV